MCSRGPSAVVTMIAQMLPKRIANVLPPLAFRGPAAVRAHITPIFALELASMIDFAGGATTENPVHGTPSVGRISPGVA